MRHYPFKRVSPKRGPVQQAVGRVLDMAGAALFLGQNERWVRLRVSRQLLPHRKFCGRYIFLRAELEQFLTDLPGVNVDEAKRNLRIRNGDDE